MHMLVVVCISVFVCVCVYVKMMISTPPSDVRKFNVAPRRAVAKPSIYSELTYTRVRMNAHHALRLCSTVAANVHLSLNTRWGLTLFPIRSEMLVVARVVDELCSGEVSRTHAHIHIQPLSWQRVRTHTHTHVLYIQTYTHTQNNIRACAFAFVCILCASARARFGVAFPSFRAAHINRPVLFDGSARK